MATVEQRRVPGFGAEGVWLRCNFHAHTTNSDGFLGPVQLARLYDQARYDVLAISDHDQLTPLPEHDGNLILMQATEISLRAPQTGGPLHILGLGVEYMPEVERTATLAETTAAIVDAGGVAVLTHPWWSGLRPDELEPYENVAALEVFNAGCEVEQGRGHAALFWDALLAAGRRVGGIATDDQHWPGFDTFRGWTMVRASERSVEAVLAALRTGDYYASTGPAILDVAFDGDELVVETSPVAAISAVAQPPYAARVNAGAHGFELGGRSDVLVGGRPLGAVDGELLTRARFTIPSRLGVKYARIQIEDERGRYAWSNPIWLDGDAG
jgi:hypothetical protein